MNLLKMFADFSLIFDLGIVPDKSWVEDEEHGLVHGYFVSFFATILAPKPCTRLIRSCLLHDYFKCLGQEEHHDKKLKSLNLDLEDATYNHSKPPDESHPLIMADRIELLRYDDWALWVNKKMLTTKFSEIDLEEFYQKRTYLVPRIKKEWQNHVLGRFG